MTLSISYREYILEQLLLEYLHEGTIPTPDQLEEDLLTYQLTHPDLTLPKTKYVDFSVERGSSSSASLIKSLVDSVSADSMVATKEIYNLANKNNLYYERWLQELNRLNIKAKRLEDEVDSLLLLTNNTEGYFATVEDFFSDMSLVDTENTTAMVDVKEQKVTLNSGSEQGSITQVNTNELTHGDISFRPLNRNSSTSYYNLGVNNTLIQMLKTENTSWVGKIVSDSPGQMTTELKIRLTQEDPISISKISLSSSSPNTSNEGTISVQYSSDGYNWFIIPTSNGIKPFHDNISWSFRAVDIKWVKFIIHKPHFDSGKYEYLYSINSIKFFTNSYHESRGTLFYSSALSTRNTSNDLVGFFKAQLQTCEEIPDNTSIYYSLSASKDNSTWTSWHDIVPFSREDSVYPKIVNFSGLDIYDNTDLVSNVLNSSYNSDKVVISFTDTDVSYRFLKPNICSINTGISILDNVEPDLVANTIEVWRNSRVQSSFPDTLTIRNIPRGWGLNGQVYSCYFEILSSSGKVINFGDRECIIDGQSFTGIVNISQGIHKFETNSDNWYDISSVLTETLSKEEYLKSIDPLYPYNHKLLIEGIPYPNSFEGEQIYTGADNSAEFYAKRTTMFELNNNNLGYGYFAVKNIGITDNILSVFLQYDVNNTDFINESNIIRWKSGNSGTGSYKYIKLKAELSSDDTGFSPELTGYRIKLGV